MLADMDLYVLLKRTSNIDVVVLSLIAFSFFALISSALNGFHCFNFTPFLLPIATSIIYLFSIIYPLYSFFCLLIGSAYYFLINPFLVEGITWISHNLIYTYFIGLVIGMTLVDFAYSIHLASKLKQFKEYEGKRFDEFKKEFKSKLNKIIKQQK